MVEPARPLEFQDLLEACSPGGASVLTSVCELQPAAGWHATVAPPRYLDGREAVYSFSRRAVTDSDGSLSPALTVLLDSKGSQANRREKCIAAAMTDTEHPAYGPVSRIPRLVLEFPAQGNDETTRYLDLELPHRWVDGHVRAGFRDGNSVTKDPQYRAMRDSTPANLRPIFDTSPLSLVDGVWDSSRKSNQVRQRSVIVGEIFGVLADQDSDEPAIARKGGARVDPIAASVQLDGKTIQTIADRQKDDLTAATYGKISKGAKDAAKKTNSGSVLGLGAVPPSLQALGGVSCTRITRSTVLSFASLRQMRFGGDSTQNIAFRALLAAAGILSMALADQELELRADCDLRESAEPVVTLDGRYGREIAISPIDVDTAIGLLEEALKHADSHGLSWNGQEFVVTGDASILAAASEDEDEAK